MRRILLLGSGGSGKSTLARNLGEITGLPVVHLDALYWQPNWTPMDEEKWQETVSGLIAQEEWIIDGNYSGSELYPRLSRADTVIVMDLPRRTCLRRVLARSLKRGSRSDMADGCEERLFSLEYWKFLKWVWGYPKNRFPKIMAAVEAHPHLKVHTPKSDQDVQQLLKAMS